MANGPSLDVQIATVTRLKSFAGLTAIIGNRVYDQVPVNAVFPYVSWGPEQIISDDASCITSFEMYLQIDAWSRQVGFPQAKQIADQVRLALHEYDLPLADNALISLLHTQTRMLRDPDGQTSHAVVEFTALVQQPS